MKMLRGFLLVTFCLLSTFGLCRVSKEEKELTGFMQHLFVALQASQNKECASYVERATQMIEAFGKKHGNQVGLKCKRCKQMTLMPRGLMMQILGQSFSAFVDVSKPNAAKKLMDEAFEIFPHWPLNELVIFMALAANKLKIKCAECSGKQWVIIEDSSSSSVSQIGL